ncbi:MAG: hypothetical protein N4A62_05235 [Marinisporobacter sp.]|nr:hypothetical protein [Marinisporobacter sp.]
MYTWRKNWVNKYESLWGVFEKFKYANSITNREIHELFSICNEKGLVKKSVSKKNSSYITMEGIDENKVKKILGYDLKKINLNNIEELTRILSNGSNMNIQEFFSSKIRICPQCMKIGYHSLWHQCTLFSECYIHQNIKLILLSCPKCMETFDYKFDRSYKDNAFRCIKCGSPYIENVNVKQMFQKWNIDEKKLIPTGKFEKWLNLNKDKENIQNKLLVYKPIRSISYHRDIKPKYYLKLLDYLGDSNILSEIFALKNMISRVIENKNIKLISYSEIHCNKKAELFDYNIEQSYISILKSIARRIRKENGITNKKIETAKRFFVKLSDYFVYKSVFNYDFDYESEKKHIDIPTFAYMMWRCEIQGLKEILHVHTKNRYNKFTYNTSEYKNLIGDTEFFEYIHRELILEQFKPSINSKCIIEHIMANLLSWHYTNWTRVIKHYKTKKTQFDSVRSTDVFSYMLYIMNEIRSCIVPVFFIKRVGKNKIEIYAIDLKIFTS